MNISRLATVNFHQLILAGGGRPGVKFRPGTMGVQSVSTSLPSLPPKLNALIEKEVIYAVLGMNSLVFCANRSFLDKKEQIALFALFVKKER